ncbi:MAG: hypothetical protein DMG08_13445 [Acidobacteria bacterium]|nr:MAG: hypothetical protein DMG08_13445 [Acidobacteriota bacterium]PYU99883.1 MAG: hypothetical protein DMG10_23190 [Acidobacteriota bacterium]PYV39414.1 MAG: hypothetical protein DMG09_09235 [Acidobacteriota bacterium]
MSDGAQKIYSLTEANELVPLIADITADVVRQLDGIRQRYKTGAEEGEPAVPEWVLKEIEDALRDWSNRVLELGAVPKGYFTVDFQSVDPELLYCWTYGEDKIAYTHKVWENFSHRKPIASSAEAPTDHLRWIN